MANQVTRADLDQAVDNVLSAVQAKAAQAKTDFQNLESALAQAQTPADYSAEVEKLKASLDAINNIDPTAAEAPAPTSNTAAAAQVNPPPPPPSSDTPPSTASPEV